MYQALYRKYRPRDFSDVTGQQHITETLRRQIETDRLSHAYLFVGTRGTGKTTCAKILSRAVNCQKPENGNPCNKCIACVGIEDGSILDVLELDAASNNGVENVRALRDEAIYSPATVKKRVYIIDEVHMLSPAAFNALLKIMEEPPEHILFVLATTELHKVPETVQSRCQKFSFKRLSSNSIIGRLNSIAKSEGLKLEDEAAQKLASLADGSMRDAISLLDQCAADKTIDIHHVEETLGLAGQQKLMQLAETVINRDIGAGLGILDELYRDGKDMAALLGELIDLMRDILIFKIAPETALLSGGIADSDLAKLSMEFSPERLLYNLEILKDALFGLSRAGSSKLAVEMCLIKISDERLSIDPSALLSRITAVENSAPEKTTPEEATSGETTPEKVASEEATPKKMAPEETAPEEATPEEAAQEETTTPTLPETGTDVTETILNHIDPAVRGLLGDSTKVSIKEKNGVLTITMEESFNANMIQNEYFDTLRETANKALGKTVKVNVETGIIEKKADKRSKLESLSAFGVVDFE